MQRMANSILNYAIVDDDDNSIRLINKAIDEFKLSFNSHGVFKCFKEASARFRITEPDIIFLNMRFPFFSGADIFGKSRARKADFIFLADDDNFVFQNIKASQYDCLLRPLSPVELKRTLKRKIEAAQLSRPLSYGAYKPASLDYKFKKLHFPTSNGYLFIHPDNILYCQADVEYTRIYTIDGRKHLISKNLKHFETVLNKKRFVRSHKSYLVNIDYIKLYVKSEGGHLIMSDEKMIPIGRSKRSTFAHVLGV